MRDPDETIADIDDALEGYVTWNGHSDDAAHWSADRADRDDTPDARLDSGIMGATPVFTIIDEVADYQWLTAQRDGVRRTEISPGRAWVGEDGVFASEDSTEPLRCATCGDPIGREPFRLETPTGTVTHRCDPARIGPLGDPSSVVDVSETFAETENRDVALWLSALSAGPPRVGTQGYSPFQGEVTVRMTADVSRFVHAMEQMGKAVAAVGKQLTRVADRQHVVLAALVYKDDLSAHRRSCRICNPHGNPKPLPVNGAEYTRRRKSRTRRNRR